MFIEKIQLEGDEQILTKVRKHWFVLAIEIVALVFAAFFPLFMLGAFEFALSSLSVTTTISAGVPLLTGLYAAWILLLWMTFGNIFTNYYLDVWVITDRRLIAIDQRGLFRRRVSSFRLERLQDLTVEINGVLATLLDFGALRAQTAGGDGQEFIAHSLPHPRELKALILRASDDLHGTSTPVSAKAGRMEI